MNFRPRTTIKGQASADFIAEFTYSNSTEVTRMTNNVEGAKAVGERGREDSVPTEGDAEQWTLYEDDASNDNGFGAHTMLISPKGIRYIVLYTLDLRRQTTRLNTRP